MIRIGITQRVESLPDRDERRDCLDQRWAPLLFELGLCPVPVPNGLDDPALWAEAAGVSGFILSGGNDLAHLPGARNTAPERDRTERALIEMSETRKLPLLGVCRGLQMLVDVHGGRLTRAEGHIAAPHALHASDTGPMPLASRERVNSFHDFAVDPAGLPAPLQSVATAPDGTVEAVVHTQARQWGVMWHPERAPFDPADRDILRALFLESNT